MKRYRNKREKARIALICTLIFVVLAGVFLVETIPWQGKKATAIWLPTEEFTAEDAAVVQKTPGKDFKILNFTDLHYNDLFTLFGLLDGPTDRTIQRLVEQVQPDLITLTGDLVWAPPYTRNSVRKLVKMMDGFGIPWAPIFGNHDRQGNVDMNWIGDRFEESEYCLFRKGYENVDGVGNYVVHIKEGDQIVYALYLFDSHARRHYPGQKKTDYDFIRASQIDWYEWAVQGTAALAGQNVESMALLHIPPIQFATAYQQWTDAGADPDAVLGRNDEKVCSAPVDGGFFDSVLAMGSTKQLVCGHDHVNNSSLVYQGIRLTYAMKTGPLIYHDDNRIGGTLFTLSEGHVGAPQYLFEDGK